jgi:hypothetical protein
VKRLLHDLISEHPSQSRDNISFLFLLILWAIASLCSEQAFLPLAHMPIAYDKTKHEGAWLFYTLCCNNLYTQNTPVNFSVKTLLLITR